jgi:hypothetical protein
LKKEFTPSPTGLGEIFGASGEVKAICQYGKGRISLLVLGFCTSTKKIKTVTLKEKTLLPRAATDSKAWFASYGIMEKQEYRKRYLQSPGVHSLYQKVR